MELFSSNIEKKSANGNSEKHSLYCISGNGNPKKASYISENETFQSTTRKFLILQETKTSKKFLIVSQKKTFLIFHETETPKKFFIFEGAETFKNLSYFRKRNFLVPSLKKFHNIKIKNFL